MNATTLNASPAPELHQQSEQLRPYFYPADAVLAAQRQSALRHAAQSWLGTPFFPHIARKGIGVDCIRLADSLLREAGVPEQPRIRWPLYAVSTCSRVCSEKLFRALQKRWQFHHFSGQLPPVLVGDILELKSKGSTPHITTVISADQLIHPRGRRGVMLDPLDRLSIQQNITRLFRIYELPLR